jgi:hypothetical protein
MFVSLLEERSDLDQRAQLEAEATHSSALVQALLATAVAPVAAAPAIAPAAAVDALVAVDGC